MTARPRVGIRLARLRRALAEQAAAVDPDFGRAELRPVANWGGFVNRSFHVRVDERRYHLKLASDPGARRGLERWRRLAPVLERRYRAPEMLGWIELPDTPFAGPLFRWVDGRSPAVPDAETLEVVLPLLDRLGGDEELRAALGGPGHAARTCADAYRDTFHDRFTEDLKAVERQPPPFVDPERLRWMWDQVGDLEGEVRRSTAFHEPADAPTHGDLWLDNLLVTASGELYVLDWDGLDLGDPVMDVAVVLGPSRTDLRPATERGKRVPEGLNARERERLPTWARATVLDWVVDSLADWVEAEAEPGDVRRIRRAKERVHEAALERYRELYPPRAPR